MSQPHLSHKIPWGILTDCCRTPPPDSINLPVGPCGRVHIIDKKTKIKVNNRKYVESCTVPDCETIGVKNFSKHANQPPVLHGSRPRDYKIQIASKIQYFSKKFYDCIVEFGETEQNKSPKQFYSGAQKQPAHERICSGSTNDETILGLFLNCDLHGLIQLEPSNIQAALQQTYGGQAVGQGYSFLMNYHVIPFYLTANAIISCGYQHNHDKWGFLRKIEELLYDCDFLTFIPSLRPYLSKEIFMVDLGETNELLKKCFRYIYVYIWMCNRVDFYGGQNGLLDEISQIVSSTFMFSY